jgi:type II secretion system protein H
MAQMAQAHQKRIGLVCGKTNLRGFTLTSLRLRASSGCGRKLDQCNLGMVKGFTLVELLVVMLIIGLIGSFVAPRLAPRTAKTEKEAFVASLNSLARAGLTQAVTTQKLHQVFWDLEQRKVEIRKHTGEYDRAGDPECKPIQLPSVTIPERFIVKQFSIEGINELAGNRNTKQVWFYIVPDGIAQQVTVMFIDTHEDVSDAEKKLTLELNPFTVRYDEVQA